MLTFRDLNGEARLVGTLSTSGGATGDVLTQQADGTLAPAPGGGSQPLQTATVTLDSGDLETLSANPVELVAAPDPGKGIAPVALWIVYAAGETPYTDNGGHLSVQTDNAQFWGDIAGEGWWDQPDSQGWNQLAQFSGATAGIDGLAVNVTNAAGHDTDPTGGDGSVIVTCLYFVADLA